MARRDSFAGAPCEFGAAPYCGAQTAQRACHQAGARRLATLALPETVAEGVLLNAATMQNRNSLQSTVEMLLLGEKIHLDENGTKFDEKLLRVLDKMNFFGRSPPRVR